MAGVRPSKVRGQNFLVQGAVADRIIQSAALAPGDEVIEIGPGLGVLTERILGRPVRRLCAIELDRRLASHLTARLGEAPGFALVQGDVLRLALAGVIERPPAVIIGNLPFAGAGAILRKLSGERRLISRMVLMFQREVAERIRAQPGGRPYGALSVFTALYWTIAGHFRVAAGNFHPRPKVDAEVLCFDPRREPPFEPGEEAMVLEVVRAAFSSPRKTVRNSLASGLHGAVERSEAALERAGIDPRARPGALAPADFVRLARALGSPARVAQ